MPLPLPHPPTLPSKTPLKDAPGRASLTQDDKSLVRPSQSPSSPLLPTNPAIPTAQQSTSPAENPSETPSDTPSTYTHTPSLTPPSEMNSPTPSPTPTTPTTPPTEVCFHCGKPLREISLLDNKPHPPKPLAQVNPDGTSTLISGLVYDTKPDGTLASVHLDCYQAAHGELPRFSHIQCPRRQIPQLDPHINHVSRSQIEALSRSQSPLASPASCLTRY